jgi:hypothetical protein
MLECLMVLGVDCSESREKHGSKKQPHQAYSGKIF